MSASRQLSFLVALSAAALLTGCASAAPPQPPSLELAKPPTNLQAVRKGDRVYLSWTVPQQTTDRQTVRSLGATHLCRSLQSAMSQCGTAVADLPAPAAIASSPNKNQPQPAKTTASLTDTLPPALTQGNPLGEITYAVEVLNANGRSAGLSNRVQVSAAPTLPPPENFAAEVKSEGVFVTWRPIALPSGSAGITYNYRVYRRNEAGNDTMLAELPLAGAQADGHVDHTFEWEKTYEYRATVVTVTSPPGGSQAQVEGDDTPPVRVLVHDVFPPAVPTGLQAVFSGAGQKPFVDLIWAPVSDADLAGYNVYRRVEGGQAEKLNPSPVNAPAYRDTQVASGARYIYSVSAVDVRGNESARSEEATESVP